MQLTMPIRGFSFLVVFIIVSCAQSQCNISEPYQLQECVALYEVFRSALYSTNNNNIFLLQSVYYPITRITPVLAKVHYNLSFTNYCESNNCPTNPPHSSPCFKDGLYTFGWTSKEIFSVFHPGVINQLRFQLPFWILQIADDISNLTDDFDIKAYLWDGIEELPSLTLRLDVNFSSDNFACKCHPSGQLIEQALGELNQWLNAFAKVTQTGTYTSASAEDKAITISCAAVERYVVENLNADARYGRKILIYSYTVGFAFAMTLAPVLVQLLFKMLEKFIKKPTLEENSYNTLFVGGASVVCCGYNILSIAAAFHQAAKYADISHEFDRLRKGFIFTIFVWSFILSAVHTLFYKVRNENINKRSQCMIKFIMFLSAVSLSTFTALLMLNFAPTVILLFAHPIDTSALIALHIALFYSTATVLAVFFDKILNWIINHSESYKVFKFKDFRGQSYAFKLFISFSLFFNILIGLMLVVLLPLTYVCIVLVYLFVVARSGNYAVDSDNLASYFPSIAIAVFGYVLKKGAFDISKQEKIEKKNSSLAELIWAKRPEKLQVTVDTSSK